LTFALVLAGYGNVARRFVELLEESRPALSALGITPVVAAVVTRRHGCVRSSGRALTTAAIAEALGQAGTTPIDTPGFITHELAALAGAGAGHNARVLIETTTLEPKSGEPAISHVRAALTAGAHVITANKGPIACAYRALAADAASRNLALLFEGAVMDGIPVFNLVRETLPAVTINGFRGVVNSTTNFLLTAMEEGEAFARALTRMQDAGVAEADASLDVDGWDAAAKGAALANVLLDADLTPEMVARETLSPGHAAHAIAARRTGRRLKVVVTGRGRGAEARVQVAIEELPGDDPLAILDGQANALELDTWPAGRIVITQRDGGLEKTAYALVSDLVTLARRLGVRA
jgi:homoserine dehydrogenase